MKLNSWKQQGKYATIAINSHRRDFIENEHYISNGKCYFISDEQYKQINADWSQQHMLYIHLWNISQELFSPYSERYEEVSKKILEVNSYISTIGRYYNKYKKMN